MCGTRNPGGRPFALLVLLLQLALAAALPLAHARVEAAALSDHVHVSSESGGVCLPHNDFDCRICRLHSVADLLIDSGAALHIPLVLTAAEPPRAVSSELGNLPIAYAFGPRAPPHA